MTHFKKCDTGKLCLFLASLLLSFQTILAQDYQTLRQNALDKLDLSGLDSKLFMNAAVTTRHEMDYLKQISTGKLSKPEPVSTEEWHNLYERMYDADLRAKNVHMPSLKDLVETNPSKLTRNDTIPLGIIGMEAVYLTEKQLRSNEDSKRARKPVDFAAYAPFRIIYAAALRQDIYQNEVWFKIGPQLIITNHVQQLAGMAIDFGDGKGFTNDDFIPAGLTPRVVPNKLFSKTKDFTFCFIQTFSAIDYKGPLNTQVQRELLDLHAVNAVTGPGRQTPFANIYGTDTIPNISKPDLSSG